MRYPHIRCASAFVCTYKNNNNYVSTTIDDGNDDYNDNNNYKNYNDKIYVSLHFAQYSQHSATTFAVVVAIQLPHNTKGGFNNIIRDVGIAFRLS